MVLYKYSDIDIDPHDSLNSLLSDLKNANFDARTLAGNNVPLSVLSRAKWGSLQVTITPRSTLARCKEKPHLYVLRAQSRNRKGLLWRHYEVCITPQYGHDHPSHSSVLKTFSLWNKTCWIPHWECPVWPCLLMDNVFSHTLAGTNVWVHCAALTLAVKDTAPLLSPAVPGRAFWDVDVGHPGFKWCSALLRRQEHRTAAALS